MDIYEYMAEKPPGDYTFYSPKDKSPVLGVLKLEDGSLVFLDLRGLARCARV